MDALYEARAHLESVVNEDLLKEYFAILRQWYLLNTKINQDEFDRKARKLLLNEDQIIAHDRFLKALLDKTSSDRTILPKTIDSSDTHKSVRSSSNKRTYESIDNGKSSKSSTRRGSFRPVEFGDYVQPLSPSKLPPNDIVGRNDANDLFIPDHSLISTRIAFTAWDNGIQNVEGGVTDIIVNACQMFVKNILTAMILRKKGYKIRDRKFQYGFNQPIPDPFLRNYRNIYDDTAESRVEVPDHDANFFPRPRPSLENFEQQIAYSYSGSNTRKTDNILSLRLLYDTLKENPSLLGSDATHKLHLLRLNLQLSH
ncbi:hypothetical protein WA026_018138 [Henosepilachna vigintioctopunctata]|uniref:Transcriptional adapter 1 n=1 Tax=Henosepilachna vigintioctopunctata TaxID=420089 RepID=A0AAW1UN65_9CUCU